jgi:hypothetical protein
VKEVRTLKRRAKRLATKVYRFFKEVRDSPSLKMSDWLNMSHQSAAFAPATVGYPERFAQETLGHNCKTVHRLCETSLDENPTVEDYEHRPEQILKQQCGAHRHR